MPSADGWNNNYNNHNKIKKNLPDAPLPDIAYPTAQPRSGQRLRPSARGTTEAPHPSVPGGSSDPALRRGIARRRLGPKEVHSFAQRSPFIDPCRKENFCGRCERGFRWGLAWAALFVLLFFSFFLCVCVCQTKRHSERGRTHTALSSDPSCWGLIFRAVHIRLLEGPENREAAPRAAFGTRPHRGGGGFQRLS